MQLYTVIHTLINLLLLQCLPQYTHTYNTHEHTRRLVDCLEVYWDMTEQSPIKLDRLVEFPESITVPQAVATWKHVAEYKENRH